MALPQDINPVNSELMDSLTRSSEMDWIETTPGSAYMKVLWLSPETGRWAVLLRWLKGHVARPHKHLSAAHAFILSGKLQVRDGTLQALRAERHGARRHDRARGHRMYFHVRRPGAVFRR